jgi:diguanylate cyclase (GGDEF)-like protein
MTLPSVASTEHRTIGVLVDSLTSYQQTVLSGIYAVALEAGLNVLVYVGRDLNSTHAHHKPANEIYSLVRQDLHGLIVFLSGIGYHLTDGELEVFLNRFMPQRTVTLSRSVQGIPGVLIDNESGMTALMEHLILKRGLRKFAFMNGFAHDAECQVRERAFLDALGRHGLEFDPKNLLFGEFFRTAAYQAALEFLDHDLDVEVIVAANDDMAYGILRAAQERGLRVPKDLAVTGFDDADLSVFTKPALTTVRQPLVAHGEQAVRSLLHLLEGRPELAPVSLPTQLVVRDSCDHHELNTVSEVRDQQASLFSILLDHAHFRFNEQYEFLTLQLLKTNLMAVNGLSELWACMPEHLVTLGMNRFFVVLYAEPAPQPTARARLAFAFQDGQSLPITHLDEFESSALLPEALQSSLHGMILVQPLFVAETHYGLLLTDTQNGQRVYQEQLCSFLSGSIHNAHQNSNLRAHAALLEERIHERTRALEQTNAQLQGEIEQRRRAERALRQANLDLRQVALVDGLTGLYNRAAFDEFLDRNWKLHIRSQHQMSLILIDIDYFKRFNDHYGHVPGDECLRAVAGVLKACVLRPTDMVARYGGEEFVIILGGTDEAGSETVISRVQQGIRQLAIPHAASEVAAWVTISIGVCTHIPTPPEHNADLIESADRALYQAKQGGRNGFCRFGFHDSARAS